MNIKVCDTVLEETATVGYQYCTSLQRAFESLLSQNYTSKREAVARSQSKSSLAVAKLGYIYKGYLKTEFEFTRQQGCENDFHKLRNE